MSTSSKLLIATTAGLMAMAAALTPASAKGSRSHHHFHTFDGPPIVVTSGYTSCDYYYSRWKQTGSRVWKSRYLVCLG